MTAVTVYHVIQALPKEELPKLYKLLGISPAIKTHKQKTVKKSKPITDTAAEEFLRANVFGTKKGSVS
ncbi:hypothetical protein C8N46_106322 [Kordia periserrulae]|uniref:Uncharacterized protein n=1 Tax=Kordia periserrulae TaxID=701523 RepID=A0A2T6BXB7_9FLAO|nr:hypothetical protein [Kordia periserrulae]PTX60676.1 hypothetical protein C8N46_106322 [Kordia periserrulae]